MALTHPGVVRPGLRHAGIAAALTAAVAAGFAVLTGGEAVLQHPAARTAPTHHVSGVETLGQAFLSVPLAFQASGAALVAHGPGSAVAFTRRGAEIALLRTRAGAGVMLRLDLIGSRAGVAPTGRGAERVSLAAFRGGTRTVSRTAFRRVLYRGAWPGADVTFTGDGRALRYSVALASGASAANITMAYRGARAVSLDRSGNLRLAVAGGALVDRRPTAYQTRDGRRVAVPVRYILHGHTGSFGFRLGAHDPHIPVTIDPELLYSAYLGGSNVD